MLVPLAEATNVPTDAFISLVLLDTLGSGSGEPPPVAAGSAMQHDAVAARGLATSPRFAALAISATVLVCDSGFSL